jgi:hypothetical protein
VAQDDEQAAALGFSGRPRRGGDFESQSCGLAGNKPSQEDYSQRHASPHRRSLSSFSEGGEQKRYRSSFGAHLYPGDGLFKDWDAPHPRKWKVIRVGGT